MDNSSLSSDRIGDMTLYELKVQCKQRNLMLSGNKHDLINRLLGKKNKSRKAERRDVLKKELETITVVEDTKSDNESMNQFGCSYDVVISDSLHLDDVQHGMKTDALMKRYPKIGLLLAAKYGFIYAANYFVNKGANNFDDAMKVAAQFGKKHIVEFCKYRGATLFNEAMAMSARYGHKEIVTICKVSGATDFDTAMANAAEGGYIKIVRKCKKWGAKNFDYTMCCAGKGGKIRIVKQCKHWGATNELMNETMKNAASKGHINIVKKCRKYGVTRYDQAVKSAISNGQIRVIELFESWNVIDMDLVDKFIGHARKHNRFSDEYVEVLFSRLRMKSII